MGNIFVLHGIFDDASPPSILKAEVYFMSQEKFEQKLAASAAWLDYDLLSQADDLLHLELRQFLKDAATLGILKKAEALVLKNALPCQIDAVRKAKAEGLLMTWIGYQKQ